MKANNRFRTFYLIYVLILIVLLAGLTVYVRKTMIAYENSSADQYVLKLVKDAGKNNSALGSYLEKNCFDTASLSGKLGDPAARKTRFTETCGKAELHVKQAPGVHDAQHPAFTVTADGKPFLTVGLAEGKTTTKLGIMTISAWDIESCVLRDPDSGDGALPLGEEGGLAYTIDVPLDFTLKMDGVPVTNFVPSGEGTVGNGVLEGTVGPIDDFQYVAPFTKVPEMLHLSLEGLTFEPVFTCTNNAGKPVDVTVRGGAVTCETKFESTKEAKAVGEAVDALAIGELWSKFMTNDVGGELHGLYTVRNNCLLLPGSDLYDQATSWAKNVDITFVSHHTITGWKNANVSNYILYSDDFFSCDVYFEKNMHLTTGADRTDVFHNRMFFVYNRDTANGYTGWRLADMAAL